MLIGSLAGCWIADAIDASFCESGLLVAAATRSRIAKKLASLVRSEAMHRRRNYLAFLTLHKSASLVLFLAALVIFVRGP